MCVWSEFYFCQGLEKACGMGDISQKKDDLIQRDLDCRKSLVSALPILQKYEKKSF